MNQIPQAVQGRLENDLANIDDLAFLAARILCKIEVAIEQGDFDPRRLKQEIPVQMRLDHTRKVLFERAMDLYIAATDFTSIDADFLDELLMCSCLDLGAYDGISACFDPKRPGVILIKLQSTADCIQFEKDIEDFALREMREIAERDGIDLKVDSDDKGVFTGKAVELKSLGLDFNLPILGVIAVCESAPDKNDIADHEYAHAQYAALVKPFMHRYLSAMAESDQGSVLRFQKLPLSTRTKMATALGPISTERSKRPVATEKTPQQLATIAKLQAAGLNVLEISAEDAPDYERVLTLKEEHNLLDELRAYIFSNGVLAPTSRITPLKMEKSPGVQEEEDDEQEGYIDPEMAERFLKLHLLLLKSAYTAFHRLALMRSLLVTSQTLAQATRLISAEVNNDAGEFDTLLLFSRFLQLVTAIAKPSSDQPELYQIGDVIIPKQEVIRTLLPPRGKFEAAVQKFDLGEDQLVAEVRFLYSQ